MDWYDTSMSQSFATCEAASPGVLLAIFGTFLVIFLLTAFSTRSSPPIMIAFPLIAAPFILLFSMLSILLAKLVVTAINAASGFAMRARTQVALTGGLAIFVCLSPILANNGPNFVLIAYFAIGILIGHLFSISMATRPATWRNWANKLEIEKKQRRPQLELKHVFSLTACCAAISSVAAISLAIATAIGTFVVVEAGLLSLDAAWVRMRSSTASHNQTANA